MKRILFVDDEPLVLDGLRDLFRKQRREWDMVFAPGGPEGIEALGGAPFDVIVSDMRMPRADGNRYCRRRDRAGGGCVISGYAGREAELAALTVAHQFVSKPCEPGVLRAIIERACALPALLASPRLRQIVGRLGRLPSPPKLYWDLTRATARHDVTMQELADLVGRIRMTAVAQPSICGSGRPAITPCTRRCSTRHARLCAGGDGAGVPGGPARSASTSKQQHAADVAALAQQFVRRAETFQRGAAPRIGVVLAIGAPDERRRSGALWRPAPCRRAEQDAGTTRRRRRLPVSVGPAARIIKPPSTPLPERARPKWSSPCRRCTCTRRTDGRRRPAACISRSRADAVGAHLPRWRALAADTTPPMPERSSSCPHAPPPPEA
jgi:CheY-like chemotaxis protein